MEIFSISSFFFQISLELDRPSSIGDVPIVTSPNLFLSYSPFFFRLKLLETPFPSNLSVFRRAPAAAEPSLVLFLSSHFVLHLSQYIYRFQKNDPLRQFRPNRFSFFLANKVPSFSGQDRTAERRFQVAPENQQSSLRFAVRSRLAAALFCRREGTFRKARRTRKTRFEEKSESNQVSRGAGCSFLKK